MKPLNHNRYLNLLKRILKADFVGWVTEKDKKFLSLNIYNAFSYYKDSLCVFVANNESKKVPVFAWIEKTNDFEGLEKWLEANRKVRILNATDGRHQENSPDFRKEKSPF